MSDEKRCPICSGENDEEQWIKLEVCKHEFHRDCIVNWHEQCPVDQRRSRCPICRRYTKLISLEYKMSQGQKVSLYYQKEEKVKEFFDQIHQVEGPEFKLTSQHGLVCKKKILAHPFEKAYEKTFGQLDLKNNDILKLKEMIRIFISGDRRLEVFVTKKTKLSLIFNWIRQKTAVDSFMFSFKGLILDEGTMGGLTVGELNIQNEDICMLDIDEISKKKRKEMFKSQQQEDIERIKDPKIQLEQILLTLKLWEQYKKGEIQEEQIPLRNRQYMFNQIRAEIEKAYPGRFQQNVSSDDDQIIQSESSDGFQEESYQEGSSESFEEILQQSQLESQQEESSLGETVSSLSQ